VPLVGVVGRLEPQKGHAYLFEAWPSIVAEFPDARLLVVGDGSLRPRLQARAQELGVAGSVLFAGFRADIPRVLDAIDVLALPSLYEGMPLTAIEASAMGRPVVATAVDGTPEVVVEGETGLLVSPGDPAGLANALCRLLGDPAGRARLGRAGRARAMDLFDQRQQVRRTQELYTAAQAGVHGTLPAIAGAGAGHGPRIP
jgi:glycosyltransferase involved in cell wall biosynthesis